MQGCRTQRRVLPVLLWGLLTRAAAVPVRAWEKQLEILQSLGQAGLITLRAWTQGLQEASVVIRTAACESTNKALSAVQSFR